MSASRASSSESASRNGRTASRESGSRASASGTSGRRESSSSRESTAEAVLRTSRAVLSAAGIEHGASGLRVQRALTRLGGRVRTSDRDALRMAFRAYYNYKAAHPEQVRKPYLYFVDYGLDADTPRGYVFDMSELRVVDGPFTVAHGRGSRGARRGAAALLQPPRQRLPRWGCSWRRRRTASAATPAAACTARWACGCAASRAASTPTRATAAWWCTARRT